MSFAIQRSISCQNYVVYDEPHQLDSAPEVPLRDSDNEDVNAFKFGGKSSSVFKLYPPRHWCGSEPHTCCYTYRPTPISYWIKVIEAFKIVAASDTFTWFSFYLYVCRSSFFTQSPKRKNKKILIYDIYIYIQCVSFILQDFERLLRAFARRI